MDLEQYLTTILPPAPAYFLAFEHGGRFQQIAAPTIASLASKLDHLNQKGIPNYYATSGFASADTRSGNNVDAKRCFYFDLDCGTNKPYPTQAAALQDLVGFLKITELPKPTFVVNSGNGIHAVWAVDTPLSPEHWSRLATALRHLANEHQLHIDPAVTQDIARVLRTPGSLNLRDPQNPKRAELMMEGAVLPVAKFARAVVDAVNGKPPPTPLVDDDADDLGGGMEHKPKYARHIAERCGYFAEVLRTGGANQSEPAWMHTLTVLAACADGQEYAHKMSKGHAGYNYHNTERKFSYRKQKIDAGEVGPTLCTTLEMHEDCTQCASCPHRATIKTPASLGYEPDEDEDPTTPPKGWKYSRQGLLMSKEHEDGSVSWSLVCPYIITGINIYKDLDGTSEVHMTIKQMPQGVENTVVLSDQSESQMVALFRQRGVFVDSYGAKALAKLATAWSRKLDGSLRVEHMLEQFGWQSDKSFCTGGRVITKEGIVPAVHKYNALHRAYTPTGDVSVWHKAAKAILEEGAPEMEVVLATAFAAPLMEFAPVSGAVLSVVSQASGTGKTTAMEVAQAVWGCPKGGGLASMDDTANALNKKIEVLNSLPVYWDEVRNTGDTRQLLSSVFRVAQGTGKQRLNAGAQFQSVGSWNSMMVLASNDSCHDLVQDAARDASDAGVRRILEMVVDIPPMPFNPKKAGLFRQLRDNHGHIGQAYAEKLVENHAKLGEKWESLSEKLTHTLHASQEERFWVSTATSILLGAQLANHWGFTNFNLDKIYSILMATIQRMRKNIAPIAVDAGETNAAYAVRMLQMFLASESEHTLHTEMMPSRGRRSLGTIRQSPGNNKPIHVHIAEGAVRIALDALRQWTIKDRTVRRYARILRGLNDINITPGLLTLGGPEVGSARTRGIEVGLGTLGMTDLYEK